MAGVDHAYQYSVEVKSRFSLFLDDALSNEDPDLLQNRLQSQRAERRKKDKPIGAVDESKVADPIPENEVKLDELDGKVKSMGAPKQGKVHHPANSVAANEATSEMSKPTEVHHESPAPRGRGAPRGFPRGTRGRGQGPRTTFGEGHQAGDLQHQSRDVHFEPRGRGRGRGGFSRGRGLAFTDHREFERPPGPERMGPRSGYNKEDQHVAETPDVDVCHPVPVPEGGDGVSAETEESEKQDEKLVNGESEPVEEEPKNYTLEEYKAMRSSIKASVALASKGTRKANDGKDVFANMVPHRKINEASDEEVEEVEKEPETELPFEINVSFTDRFSERGRGSFGGRGNFDRGRGAPGFRGAGRSRGRGPRGGFRGAGRGRGFGRGMAFEHHAAPPPIYSDQDFPSLK